MTASLLFSLVSLIFALGCGTPARDARVDDSRSTTTLTTTLTTARGELRADGSCAVLVDGAPLFPAADAARTAYDSGAVADVAPAGYTLHQLVCAPAGTDPTLLPERADERLLIVTLYVRDGSTLRPGRFVVRAGLADASDSTGIASRAGIAIFGAQRPSGGASGAGVRYLEAREGTLEIASVDGARVVGRFDVRVAPAWSM